MAKIRDYSVSINSTAAASIAVEMPEHVSGDLLLFWFNKDTASGGPSTPSGWSVPTAFGSNPLNSAGSGNYLFAKRATSNSEALGSVAYTSETAICIVIAISGCFGSTVDDAITNLVKAGADDSTLPLGNGASINPTYANSLILNLFGSDGGLGPSCLPGWIHLFGGDAGANSLAVSYTHQESASSISHPGYWAGTADDSRNVMLAIRDDGNLTDVEAYVDQSTVGATLVSPLLGASGVTELGTWKPATPLTLATIGSKSTVFDSIGSTADSGWNPFNAAASFTPAVSVANLAGSELAMTTAAARSRLFGLWAFTLPRDYIDTGKTATGGLVFVAADAENDYKAWTIGAQLDKTTKPLGYNPYSIQIDQSINTQYASSGTLGNIARYLWLVAGIYGAPAWRATMLWELSATRVYGGSPTTPMNFDQLANAVNNGTGTLPLFDQSGAAATIWTDIRIGGSRSTHCLIDGKVFQWPRAADGVDYLNFHVDPDTIGIDFHGSNGDTLHFPNCVFTSDSSFLWGFASSHDPGASLDFSGTRVAGAKVTLRDTVELEGITFLGCTRLIQNGATLTGIAVVDTKLESATLADMALVTDSAFTSSGTGHAIEVSGTADTITLVGNTFDGYAPTNGSTGNEAIFVNIASGTVTLNISGGDTPSIRTSGATVVVNNSVTITIAANASLVGAEVRIYDMDGAGGTDYGTELAGAESHDAATFVYSGAVGNTILIQIMKPGYVEFTQQTTMPAASATLDVSLTQDLNA